MSMTVDSEAIRMFQELSKTSGEWEVRHAAIPFLPQYKRGENWCAVAMIGFFFLPWVQFLGVNASGYDITKLGSYANWAWAIPVAAGLTVAFSFAVNNAKPLAIITGLLPFIGLAYVLSQMGKDLFHILAIGVYLTLVVGLLMILFASGVLGFKTTPAADHTE
ncbi:MAG: hypothetical protein HY265_08645 [Deltaproteobacteria bacterium]|nr:hypothetical protein [Deltaproteobacteria bacterium]